MTHYRSNLRDVEFNLFEFDRIQERFDGPFAQMDEPTARAILAWRKRRRQHLLQVRNSCTKMSPVSGNA